MLQTTFYGGGGANSPYQYYTSTRGVAAVIDLGRHGWLVAMKDFVLDAHDQSCEAVTIQGLLDAFRLDAKDLVKLRSGKRDLGAKLLPQFVWFPRGQPYRDAKPVCADRFGRVIGASIELKAATIEIVPKASLRTVQDVKTPWLDEMRIAQPQGSLSTRTGEFIPMRQNIEHTGSDR
ncbi:MAG: hypothetical protein HOO99_14805 [Hyphomicrobiaceae bacterium]|nr:hypothetical protein [Hyphomicrobiaceae bacterium]